eukprot:296645-Pyramimonas_sp.AAC.3
MMMGSRESNEEGGRRDEEEEGGGGGGRRKEEEGRTETHDGCDCKEKWREARGGRPCGPLAPFHLPSLPLTPYSLPVSVIRYPRLCASIVFRSSYSLLVPRLVSCRLAFLLLLLIILFPLSSYPLRPSSFLLPLPHSSLR